MAAGGGRPRAGGHLARPAPSRHLAARRPDRRRQAGPAALGAELLADERRLFYVACTRARDRLVVTAVASADDEGEQPSRFLEELFPDVSGHRIRHVPGRPERPLSWPGLVAELRRTLADPTTAAPLRAAAATRLARLATAHRAREAWVPAADPASWWGTRAWTRGDQPLRAEGRPGAGVGQRAHSLVRCPAQWFWEREAGGTRAATQAQGFRQRRPRAGRPAGPARGETDLDAALAEAPVAQVVEALTHVDRVWGQIPFRTPWSSHREQEEARAALTGSWSISAAPTLRPSSPPSSRSAPR
ncbi:MAG: hypothetical protein R2734_05800 [Nocardioides sp.]